MKNVEDDRMKWLIFDVDGVLIDVSESFDIAVKKTVEKVLESIDKTSELDLNNIRNLREKGIFSDDFELSKAFILGKIKYRSFENFVDEFPERGSVDRIEDSVDIEIKDSEVKNIFNSYYLGDEYENSLFDSEPAYKREKRIVELNLIKKAGKRFKIGIITGRDRKEMELAEDIIGYKFDNVITRDEFEKPDPNCLKALLGSDEGIYIGDTETDRKMVERYNELHNDRVEFYKVTKERNVVEVLKEIMKKKVSCEG